jgi:hypothetical protein
VLFSSESSASETNDENQLERQSESSGKISKKKQRQLKNYERMFKNSFNRSEVSIDGVSKLFNNPMKPIN